MAKNKQAVIDSIVELIRKCQNEEHVRVIVLEERISNIIDSFEEKIAQDVYNKIKGRLINQVSDNVLQQTKQYINRTLK